MKLHNLKRPKNSTFKSRRVGRGRSSGSGKTSGRGQKGQMSRSGSGHKPLFEGGQMPMVRRLPKRGFVSRNKKVIVPVNLEDLNRFEEGSDVGPELLRETGLVNGRCDGVKILSKGEINKKLNLKAHAFSSSALSKIEAAGGTCEVISPKKV